MSYLELGLAALKESRRRKAETPVAAPSVTSMFPGGAQEVEPTLGPEDVAAMDLDAFASAGLVAVVRSEVLQETVLFASDNATLDPGERRPVYRAAELRELDGVDVETLRTVHEVKKLFGGTVEAT